VIFSDHADSHPVSGFLVLVVVSVPRFIRWDLNPQIGAVQIEMAKPRTALTRIAHQCRDASTGSIAQASVYRERTPNCHTRECGYTAAPPYLGGQANSTSQVRGEGVDKRRGRTRLAKSPR
jgi:hypothetical protein